MTFRNLFALFITALICFYAGKQVEQQPITTQLQNLEFETLLTTLDETINSSKQPEILREAIIVRLANKAGITMYGRQINDKLSDKNVKGRKKYELHPYGKAGSGSHDVVTYTDKKTDERYILLVRKYKKATDKSAGLADQLSLVGGYMAPHHLEGGDIIDDISSEEKDMAEEAILTNKDGYKDIEKSAKEIQASQSFDLNLEQTAIRELEEEAGIIWDISKQGLPVHLSTRSTYGITNDKRLYTIVGDYLFDLGAQIEAPITKPGSDIGAVYWVKIKDITIDNNITPQEYGSKLSRYSAKLDDGTFLQIRDDHGEVIITYAKNMLAL